MKINEKFSFSESLKNSFVRLTKNELLTIKGGPDPPADDDDCYPPPTGK